MWSTEKQNNESSKWRGWEWRRNSDCCCWKAGAESTGARSQTSSRFSAVPTPLEPAPCTKASERAGVKVWKTGEQACVVRLRKGDLGCSVNPSRTTQDFWSVPQSVFGALSHPVRITDAVIVSGWWQRSHGGGGSGWRHIENMGILFFHS